MARKPERVFVGLGSNVGNRGRFLGQALRRLEQSPGIRVVAVSPFYETSPVGPRQRSFLNAVAEIRSALSPEHLLAHLKSIESELGRRRRRRWGPREIDLDLLFFGAHRHGGALRHGGARRREGALDLPHPRWKERKFVLWPLADIAPRFRDPISGRTVAQFRAKLTDPSQSIKLYRRALSQ